MINIILILRFILIIYLNLKLYLCIISLVLMVQSIVGAFHVFRTYGYTFLSSCSEHSELRLSYIVICVFNIQQLINTPEHQHKTEGVQTINPKKIIVKQNVRFCTYVVHSQTTIDILMCLEIKMVVCPASDSRVQPSQTQS